MMAGEESEVTRGLSFFPRLSVLFSVSNDPINRLVSCVDISLFEFDS